MTPHTKKKALPKYESPTCGHCGQRTHYVITLARGHAVMLLAIANAIRNKGTNRIHLLNEMVAGRTPQKAGFSGLNEMVAAGKMTVAMRTNASQIRAHGLIATHDKGSGEYLLTRKGASFLRGTPISRTAIIEKRTHHNVGYWNETDLVEITALLTDRNAEFWSIPRFDVDGDRVIPENDSQQKLL